MNTYKADEKFGRNINASPYKFPPGSVIDEEEEYEIDDD